MCLSISSDRSRPTPIRYEESNGGPNDASRARHLDWAKLLERVFAADVLVCLRSRERCARSRLSTTSARRCGLELAIAHDQHARYLVADARARILCVDDRARVIEAQLPVTERRAAR